MDGWMDPIPSHPIWASIDHSVQFSLTAAKFTTVHVSNDWELIYKAAQKRQKGILGPRRHRLAATQIGAGIAQTIILSRLRPSFKAQDAKVMTSTIIQTAGSLLCDVAITGHLYLTLNRMKNLHSYPDTYRDRANRKFVDSTTVWIVNRGAITASVSGVTMALFLRWPDTFWFVLTLAPCSKLYMNGMLAIYSLNVRDYLRENLFKGNHQEPGVEGAEVVDPNNYTTLDELSDTQTAERRGGNQFRFSGCRKICVAETYRRTFANNITMGAGQTTCTRKKERGGRVTVPVELGQNAGRISLRARRSNYAYAETSRRAERRDCGGVETTKGNHRKPNPGAISQNRNAVVGLAFLPITPSCTYIRSMSSTRPPPSKDPVNDNLQRHLNTAPAEDFRSMLLNELSESRKERTQASAQYAELNARLLSLSKEYKNEIYSISQKNKAEVLRLKDRLYRQKHASFASLTSVQAELVQAQKEVARATGNLHAEDRTSFALRHQINAPKLPAGVQPVLDAVRQGQFDIPHNPQTGTGAVTYTSLRAQMLARISPTGLTDPASVERAGKNLYNEKRTKAYGLNVVYQTKAGNEVDISKM
ncbi:hypothetical protein B0H11DRAFT_1906798 [Mycena galericulata]|nr:hypothetical protein B0H11DRAFT_1906798 [Mycena galericulata]